MKSNNLPTYSDIHKRSYGKLSDKWDLYLEVYHQLLSEYRDKPVSLLEIGVQNGGSLESWAQYFSNAESIIGCDINEQCAYLVFEDPRIHVIIGDATKPETIEKIEAFAPSLDVVIEDGSHLSRDIIRSFAEFFPRIRPGGIYIAEDLHCCYWNEWGGGLCRPDSGVEFFKALCDCLNSKHWHRPDINENSYINSISEIHDCFVNQKVLESILSIEFYDSICVIRKCSSNRRSRILSRETGGKDELVVEGLKEAGREMLAYPQSSRTPRSLLEAMNEFNRLSGLVESLTLEFESLTLEASAAHNRLNYVEESLTWKLVKPIRIAEGLMLRLIRKMQRMTQQKTV